MTTTKSAQEKQTLSEQFKPNQHVFYIKKKVKAVVKTVNEKTNEIYISYHPRGGKHPRVNKWVDAKYITEWIEKENRTNVRTPVNVSKTYRNKDNRYYSAVKDFHTVFNCGVTNIPTPMSADLALTRMSWDLEESIEMLHASSSNLEEFKNLYDKFLVNGYQTFLKLTAEPFPEDKLLAQVDAIGDKLYFNQGDFVLIGVKPDGVFDGIQNSNMGKLWDDGQPHYRESDGKIIKPEGWQSPELAIRTELDRQIAEAVQANQ